MNTRVQTPTTSSRNGHVATGTPYRKGNSAPTEVSQRLYNPTSLTPSSITKAQNILPLRGKSTRVNTAVLSSPRKNSAPAKLSSVVGNLDSLPSTVTLRRKISAPSGKPIQKREFWLTPVKTKKTSAPAILTPSRISKDHGSSGSQGNISAASTSKSSSGGSYEGKPGKKSGGPFATKETLSPVKEEKKLKKAHKKSSPPPAVKHSSNIRFSEKAMDEESDVNMQCSEAGPQVAQCGCAEVLAEKIKLERMVSDLVRSSECKTQELATLKIEINRLKEALREKSVQPSPDADFNREPLPSCVPPTAEETPMSIEADLTLEHFEKMVNNLTSENTVLRRHLHNFGISLDGSPLCDQQKEMILSTISAMSNQSGLGMDVSSGGIEKEWDAKSSSSISEISVACLQGRIHQMEETHYSTNEELQATLQELDDLKEQLTECQLEAQQIYEEKQVTLESLTQQTEKLNEARLCNESLKLLLIQQSENNQDISQCERTQRLMELLKNVQEDKELLQMKQEELETQLNAGLEAEEHYHREAQLIADRIKLLESMADAANNDKKNCECQLLDAQEVIKTSKQDVDRLKLSLASTKEKVAELEANMRSGEKSELADVLERVCSEKESLEKEVLILQKKVNSHLFENERLKDQLVCVQNEYKTNQNKAKTNLNDVEWQRMQLDKRRCELELEVDSMRGSISDLQATCQRHLEDKRELKANFSEAQKKIAELIDRQDEIEKGFSEERAIVSKQVDEWDQYERDLLTTVRVANDFKTEAQHDLDRLLQENQILKEKIKLMDLERVKASTKLPPMPNNPLINSPVYSNSISDRRLIRTVSLIPNGEAILGDRRSNPRPLARGDSRVKSLIESIECATKQTRAGSRSSSTSSLASTGSENMFNIKSVPVLKRADTDSVIRNLPGSIKDAINITPSPLRVLNCNVTDSSSFSKHPSSINMPDAIKMSQLSNDKNNSKFNTSFGNSGIGQVDVMKPVSLVGNKLEAMRRNSYGQVSSVADKKDPLASLAQRGDTKRNALLKWCQNKTGSYPHVDITNFSTSWNDGLAFCAILDTYLPDKIKYSSLNPQNKKTNFDVAFSAAESVGIQTTLDTNDMITSERPNWQSVFNYMTSVFCHFET